MNVSSGGIALAGTTFLSFLLLSHDFLNARYMQRMLPGGTSVERAQNGGHTSAVQQSSSRGAGLQAQ